MILELANSSPHLDRHLSVLSVAAVGKQVRSEGSSLVNVPWGGDGYRIELQFNLVGKGLIRKIILLRHQLNKVGLVCVGGGMLERERERDTVRVACLIYVANSSVYIVISVSPV